MEKKQNHHRINTTVSIIKYYQDQVWSDHRVYVMMYPKPQLMKICHGTQLEDAALCL